MEREKYNNLGSLVVVVDTHRDRGVVVKEEEEEQDRRKRGR